MLSGKMCSFCGREVKLGYGIMLVRNDGSIEYFCSSKCRKNALNLKRDPRKFKWTAHHRKGEKI
ncbi:MAG: 50S ribosomal protein L24e [Thaumarchaeota archaeon]|jgi:large subunit ribosomal protein L24e|nr:50S ribosomal protein L24e [Nitrososphaerota archaeon]